MSNEDEKSGAEETAATRSEESTRPTRVELEQFKRRDLQRLAKTEGIKANQKTSEIIEQLLTQWAQSNQEETIMEEQGSSHQTFPEKDPNKENVDANQQDCPPNDEEDVVTDEPSNPVIESEDVPVKPEDVLQQDKEELEESPLNKAVSSKETNVCDETGAEGAQMSAIMEDAPEKDERQQDPMQSEDLADPSEQTDITEVTESSDLCRQIDELNTDDTGVVSVIEEEEKEEAAPTSLLMDSGETSMIHEMEILPRIEEEIPEDEDDDGEDDMDGPISEEDTGSDTLMINESEEQQQNPSAIEGAQSSSSSYHHSRSPPTGSTSESGGIVDSTELSEALKSTLEDSALLANPEVERIQRTMLEMKQSVEERRARVHSMWESLKSGGMNTKNDDSSMDDQSEKVDDSSYLREHQDLVRLQAKFVSVCSDYVAIVTPAKARLNDRSRLINSTKTDVSDKEFVSKQKAELMQERGFIWDQSTREWIHPKHTSVSSKPKKKSSKGTAVVVPPPRAASASHPPSQSGNLTRRLPDFDAIHRAEFDRSGEDLADYQRRKEERRRSLSAYTPFAGRSGSSATKRKNRGMRSRPESGTPAVKRGSSLSMKSLSCRRASNSAANGSSIRNSSVSRPQTSLNGLSFLEDRSADDPKRKLQWSERRRSKKRSLLTMDETSSDNPGQLNAEDQQSSDHCSSSLMAISECSNTKRIKTMSDNSLTN